MKAIEDLFERLLFGARWLLAPFYAGLIVALLLLLVVFARELAEAVEHVFTMKVEGAILVLLSLIDLALAANLVLIITLAGYENFVSKIDTEGHEDRPSWMGHVGFSGLKLKLYASIVAISGIKLLKVFMSLGTEPFDTQVLMWLTIVHVVFVLTTLASAATDWLSSRAKGSEG